MDPIRESFNDTVERQLTRFSCDIVVDASAAGIAAALAELTTVLETGGASQLAERLRHVATHGDEPHELPAVFTALWREWFAEDEVRRDVEALSGDAELCTMFIGEALDHLGTIEATLLRLEDNPADVDLLNEVFRPFHTLKGNAGALGVSTVQGLAHRVENLLDRCRSGRHRVGSNEVDVVLKAVDLLSAMLNDLAARCEGRPGRALRLERLFLIDAVDRLIAVGNTLPVGTPAADGLTLDDTPASASASDAAALSDPANGDSHAAVKIDTRKLDALVDTVGELVILQSLIYEDPALTLVADERLTRNLTQLRRITTELQRGTMSMRMVPIRQTFHKLSRLVRDVSKRSGKAVDLVLAGEDTELDRKVVEDINDPLMHMVRNSVDHGIEMPEVRRAAGKPEAGRLSLRAFHQGGGIVIEIVDDGAGLNTEKIARKAVERGLIADAARVSPAELHQLIFAPGFSTAERVTEISGRGVGMDVVKRNIDALRGTIDIRTQAGQGTTFSIKLPLTMAILDGLLVAVGAQRFLIPTFAIRESLRPQPTQLHTVRGERRLIQVRDQLLPLVWLSELFDIEGAVADPSQATVVVIEDDMRRVGLVVDTLVGKHEVVVKSLGAAFAGLRGVAGGAILGDGRIGLILDAHGLIDLMRGSEAA
jgi:two-component system chemotaxis sensor kinase CheA